MSSTQTNRLKYLLDQYSANALSQTEFAELIALMGQEENEAEIKAALMGDLDTQDAGSYDRIYWADQFRKMNLTPTLNRKQGEEIPVRRMFSWKRVAVAASILLVVGLGLIYVIGRNDEGVTKQSPPVAKDVSAPANNRAMITLADGRIVYLDSAANGSLANENGVSVSKLADGKVVYTPSTVTTSTAVALNTLSNPRGSKVIDITLSDGSRVWLNAGSSLRYPASFASSRLNRTVEITGEAYFEVSHDKTKPFFVTKGEIAVQVLGTHFNVNAYDDESEIKVTLLEGSVKVLPTALAVGTIIKPGQQASISQTSQSIPVQTVDVDEVMAWKNGRFEFKGTALASILRQVQRWYDVEIVYETEVAGETFTGGVPRQENVSQLLKMLELTNTVHFRIEGKKIVVMK